MQQQYEEKFPQFIKMCESAKQRGADGVLVHHPQVLGDTYDEICESLDRLADGGLSLRVLPRSARGDGHQDTDLSEVST